MSQASLFLILIFKSTKLTIHNVDYSIYSVIKQEKVVKWISFLQTHGWYSNPAFHYGNKQEITIAPKLVVWVQVSVLTLRMMILQRGNEVNPEVKKLFNHNLCKGLVVKQQEQTAYLPPSLLHFSRLPIRAGSGGKIQTMPQTCRMAFRGSFEP